MAREAEGLSVPHARLPGTWEVLRETDDGRPTIALREDGRSGVALAYPYAEGPNANESVNKVATVVNTVDDYVLLSASFDSIEAADRMADDDAPRERVDIGEFNRLDRAAVNDRLADGTLLLIDVGGDAWYPGALRLFDTVAEAREAWVDGFPVLADRLVAVQRLLAGMGLHEVVRRLDTGGDGGSGATSP